MTGFKLQTFSGQAPKVYARLLPEDMAQVATNCRLDSGRLEPWKGNLASSVSFATGTISGATKSIFKHSSSVWIASNAELDIVRSPIAEDPHERIYITGFGGSSGFPQMTTAQIIGSSQYYRLGIPKPEDLTSVTLTPAVSANVDTEVPQSRSYVFTYVSYYGEEGVNCDAEAAQVVDVHTDQTVTLDFPSNPSGNYNLLKKRVYRTDAGGTYRFLQTLRLQQIRLRIPVRTQIWEKRYRQPRSMHRLTTIAPITLRVRFWVWCLCLTVFLLDSPVRQCHSVKRFSLMPTPTSTS